MDNDRKKDKVIVFSTPMNTENFWMEAYDKFHKQWQEELILPPRFMGVDWSKDSGMNRGDVYKREGNVIYARFKTVEVVHGR